MTDPQEPARSPAAKSDVWDYVRRRNELDREIQEKFARPVTIMFTDIKGSTTFFDMRGDLEGVTMLQRHNELVVPPIEASGGRVLQRLGDGLLATFPTAAAGVRAGIDIQKRLHEHNGRVPESEQIHVRVGLNTGMGLVEESNVFGDAVNTAARVQTLAEPGQVLVSDSTYQEARRDLGTDIFLPIGPSALKGKLQKVVVLEVMWSPEQGRLRAAAQSTSDPGRAVLHVDVSRVATRLRVASRETVAGQTTAAAGATADAEYDEVAVDQAVQRIEAILAGVDRDGRIGRQQLEELAGLGQQLWHRLLPEPTRARVAQSSAPELVLTLDGRLTHIPWELLNDGREFLCLRFGMGRVLGGGAPLAAGTPREPRNPLKIAVVADPQGTLPHAQREGTLLGTMLGDRPEYQVVVNDRGVSRVEFLAQFGGADVVHVAGQVDYDAANAGAGGFALQDGRMTAADLARLPGGAAVPRLVFFTACEADGGTGRPGVGEPAVFAFAAAILDSGVHHFVGSRRAVPGAAGFQLAHEFYRQLAAGQSVGLALREARREAARRHGKTGLAWASSTLYGDPTARYVSVVAPVTARRSSLLPPKRLMALLAGAAVVVVTAGLYFVLGGAGARARLEAGYQHLEAGRLQDAAGEFQAAIGGRPAEAYEGLALCALRQNDAVGARKYCAEAEKRDARRPGCVLVRGDAVAQEGDLPRAAASYEAVVAYAGVPRIFKSIAYTRLGRLAADEGQPDRAHAAYARAAETDPSNWEAISDMGALLRRQGRYAEAAAALEKAATLNPGDPLVQTLLKDVRDSEGASQDSEKARRVDALVNDLAARFRRGETVQPPAGRDDWTSPPLTVSLMGLEGRGRLAFREGEHDFLLLRIGQALESQTRARLVERAVIDKLLAELKLSSSALVDPRTALQLGRVLSARLITAGTVERGGPDWALTLRVIETETSTVVASIAQSFPASQSAAQVADAVARELAGKLRNAFPLRARVVGGGAGEVVLNVGTGEGATVGQKLMIFRERPGGRREVVGEAEISEVTDKQSRAKVSGEARPLPPGLKALERI